MEMNDKLVETTKRQNQAADPNLSAWVSANAGSGKTYVLVKRVIRTLLQGTKAHKILCLTFTKTAAQEMQNRLFKTLSEWAVLRNEDLLKEIKQLIGFDYPIEKLDDARRLFAEALETPGGLKIQTIHAFCERILHSFPIEAGISPQFEVIDERKSAEMLDSIKQKVLEDVVDEDGRFGNALNIIASYINEQKFDELLNQMISKRAEISKIAALEGQDISQDSPNIGSTIGYLADALQIDDLMMQAIEYDMHPMEYFKYEKMKLNADQLEDLKGLSLILREDGGKNNVKFADQMDAFRSMSDVDLRIDAYFSMFFTAKMEPRKSLVTAKIKKEFGELVERITDMQLKAVEQYDQLMALKMFEASTALFEIGNDILWQFIQAKNAQSLLDYDDLIHLTAKLLSGDGDQHDGQAAWILYKLDNGLDHILIDEAQDTSPAQWQVIEPLVEEITLNQQNAYSQSLFVVGDEKQSIYRFQGADRDVFKQKEQIFASKFKQAEKQWAHIGLDLSFRSTDAVLHAVDQVFAFADAASGVYDDILEEIKEAKEEARHFAHRKAPGLVELWEVEQGDEVEIPDAWRAPLDEIAPTSPLKKLADKMGHQIADWIEQERPLKSQNRPVRAGDFLILVRRRNEFVHAITKVLKARGVSVAGTDRLRLSDALIVEDLILLAEVCLFPQDDLKLATLLRSPLFDVSEDELFDITHNRKGQLFLAIKQNLEPKWREISQKLSSLIKHSKMMRPFDFYSQLLVQDEMRQKMIGRLGFDAVDALDEFLNMVETYELANPANLAHFVTWFKGDESDLKREIDLEKDELRIMTVHGAKGLEANIVMLPDTCQLPDKSKNNDLGFYFVDDQDDGQICEHDFAYWRPNSDVEPKVIKQIKAQNYEKEIEEYHRLLYVAMTRASDELYIAGYSKRALNAKADYLSWYQLVEKGMIKISEEDFDANGARILRFATQGDEEPAKAFDTQTAKEIILPDWVFAKISQVQSREKVYAPSLLLKEEKDALFEPSLKDEAVSSPLQSLEEKRFLRGTIIHKLLENLPKIDDTDRDAALMRYLSKYLGKFESEQLEEMAEEVNAVIAHPNFGQIFNPEAQSEVSIVGHIEFEGKQKRISGQIDRLVMLDNEILILDYKSNRPPPKSSNDVDPQYIAQMAAYRAVLEKIYKDHNIRVAILWTFEARLMLIEDELMDQVLPRIFEN